MNQADTACRMTPVPLKQNGDVPCTCKTQESSFWNRSHLLLAKKTIRPKGFRSGQEQSARFDQQDLFRSHLGLRTRSRVESLMVPVWSSMRKAIWCGFEVPRLLTIVQWSITTCPPSTYARNV